MCWRNSNSRIGIRPFDLLQLSPADANKWCRAPRITLRAFINFEKTWNLTGSNEVTYTNLSPGEYIFSVQGLNTEV